MPRWVRSYWDDGDITFLWEVRDDGWIARSVELAGPERRPQAAAALDEAIRARDAGGIRAVQAYEARYGVAPDQPIEAWDFPHEDISQSDFERAWVESRHALAVGGRPHRMSARTAADEDGCSKAAGYRLDVDERGCDYCRDDQNMHFGHVEQVASNLDHGLLLRCPQCGWLYVDPSDGRSEPAHVDAAQAASWFGFRA